MAEDYQILKVRCLLSGHLFDFNEDLGAVAIGKGAACTHCMDRMFNEKNALNPNGERQWVRSKTKAGGSK